MLSLAHQHCLLPYVVALVAALSVQELFVEIDRPAELEEEVRIHVTTFKLTFTITTQHFLCQWS